MDQEDKFQLTKNFKSYVSKPEITDLLPTFLVRGSKNVLIDYAKRIVSRNGYTLFGQENTGLTGAKSSYDWDTSTAKQIPIRCVGGQRVEFYWNDTWNLLKTGFASITFDWAKVWDNTEKIDVLLGVNGSANTYKWSGGASRVASSTATTLKKQGVLSLQAGIAFVPGNGTTLKPTITDTNSGFVTAGFAIGDTLYITGSVANSRVFTIASVTAGTIELIMSDTLVAEAAGANSITMHNGEPTWASSRFLTTGTRSLWYNGTEYTYTGGESTDTLTGLTAFPTVTPGEGVWQSMITIANPGAIASGFRQDRIGVQLNQVVFASSKSQEVYGSAVDDYTDFTLTSPRAPGDPFKVNMDNYCTCIVPMDNQDQTVNSLMFGGGTSEFFQLKFEMSQDLSSELVRMIKLKTATGSGLIAQGAIAPIKNLTAYISREPTLDTLGAVEQVEGSSNVPISDAVKDDFDMYDFTDAHMKYWKRAIYIAVPREGLVLIYDLQRKLWQPPQTIPVSRLAIIDDWLYGHSSISNETYKLFVGTNDNGIFIPQVARFAYDNGGKRNRVKNMSKYWTDGYISGGGALSLNLSYGFDGDTAYKVMPISGADRDIVTSQAGSHLGDTSLGFAPLGGSPLTARRGLTTENAGTLLRFWQTDTVALVDYVEYFAEYTMNTLDAQFAIVAHGSNQWDAGAVSVTHTK